jgi:hypothetical protein
VIKFTKQELINLHIAFDTARAIRKNPATGKEYTITQFAEQYLKQSPSMVSKIFGGVAKSEPVIKAIAQFVLDSELDKVDHAYFKLLALNIINRSNNIQHHNLTE